MEIEPSGGVADAEGDEFEVIGGEEEDGEEESAVDEEGGEDISLEDSEGGVGGGAEGEQELVGEEGRMTVGATGGVWHIGERLFYTG